MLPNSESVALHLVINHARDFLDGEFAESVTRTQRSLDCRLAIMSLYIFLVLFSISSGQYINEWTVHIPKGAQEAQKFAKEHGFVNLGEVVPDSNHFHMKYPKLRSKRSLQNPSEHVTNKILEHPEVEEAEQQVAKIRQKRDSIFNDPDWDKMWYLNRGNDLGKSRFEFCHLICFVYKSKLCARQNSK